MLWTASNNFFLFWICVIAEKFQNVHQENHCHAVSQMQLICPFLFHTYLLQNFLQGKNLFFPLLFLLFALISVGNFSCLLQVVELNCELICSVNQNSSRTLRLYLPVCLTRMNTSYLCLQISYFPLCDTIPSAFPAVKLLWDYRNSATFREQKIDLEWRTMKLWLRLSAVL